MAVENVDSPREPRVCSARESLVQLEGHPTASQRKLTMRAKAHKFKAVVIQHALDENEIRPDVAVATGRFVRRTVGDRNSAAAAACRWRAGWR